MPPYLALPYLGPMPASQRAPQGTVWHSEGEANEAHNIWLKLSKPILMLCWFKDSHEAGIKQP